MYLRTIPALLVLFSTLLFPVASSGGVPFGAGGGRKIALVIDSSGSNIDTDPSDLRIAAAKEFNDRLTTNAEAGKDGHGQPDQVTIIDFDDTATVVYPLGDPAGASFLSIDSFGGTYIAGGIETALTELTKDPSSPTGKRTGIVVLTDGQDSSVSPLITQLNNATSQAIRVCFGFLQTPGDPADPATEVVTAILRTGGIYSNIDSAAAQANFVKLIIAHGPTAVDSPSGTTGESPLFPGLSEAHLAGPVGSENTFTYTAAPGEKLTYTLQSLTQQSLRASVGGKTAETNNMGFASIVVTATKNDMMKMVVRVLNGTEGGVYTLGLNSTIDPSFTAASPSPTPKRSAAAAGLLPQVAIAVTVVAAMFLVAF